MNADFQSEGSGGGLAHSKTPGRVAEASAALGRKQTLLPSSRCRAYGRGAVLRHLAQPKALARRPEFAEMFYENTP